MPAVNKTIEYKGECLSLRQWSSRTGISASTLSDRLRRGWSVEKALTTPPKKLTRVPDRAYAQSEKCRGCRFGRPLYAKSDAPFYCAFLELNHCRRPWLAAECPGYRGNT